MPVTKPVLLVDQRPFASLCFIIAGRFSFAGEAIKQITSHEQDPSTKSPQGKDRQTMVQAAGELLSAVTRVLILADTVVVKQIIVVKKNVTNQN